MRDRDGEGCFGRSGLNSSQQEQADLDASLFLKNLMWIREVRRRNKQAAILIEQPMDPLEWAPPGSCKPPSFLCWPETRELIRDLSLTEVKFDQGSLGHRTRKPTTVITDLPQVVELQGKRSSSPGEKWPETVEGRINMSGELAQWAPGLVEVIREAAWQRCLQPQAEALVCRLTAQQKGEAESWERHCRMGHIPYRKDCHICVQAAGRDRPRRRVPCPDSFCMGIDMTGPFPPGKDQEINQPRYAMVATITVPVDADGPLIQGLKELRAEKVVIADDWMIRVAERSMKVLSCFRIPCTQRRFQRETGRTWQP